MRKTLIPESKPIPFTESIKTIEDVYKAKGLTPETYVELSDNLSHLFPFTEHFIKYLLLIEVLNNGWIPNWDDKNEKKFYPYFNMNSSAFELDSVSCNYERSSVPSRLCFRTRELAEHAIKHFPELIKSVYTTI